MGNHSMMHTWNMGDGDDDAALLAARKGSATGMHTVGAVRRLSVRMWASSCNLLC